MGRYLTQKGSPAGMPQLTSPKQICEIMWGVEDRFGLLHRPFRDVLVWQLLRMEIYYKLAKGSGVYSTPHTNKDTLLDSIKAMPSLLDIFLKNPLRGDYRKDILVFDHMRKIPLGGEYADIYTKFLIDDLDNEAFDVIESVYLGKHLTPKTANRKYLDILAVSSYLKSHLNRISFSSDELSLIDTIVADIARSTGVALPLKKMFADEINHFNVGLRFYTKLLEKRQPKRIYLVVSYSFYKRPLIAAAKRMGIQTIEIQHGTLSPYHLGYNFPNDPGPLDYFPDRFLTFGEYWRTAASYPLPQSQIDVYGFPFFRNQRRQYTDIPKNPNQILFISQGVIGKQLSRMASTLATQLKNKHIIYKLHPGEYDRWRSEYTELVEASALDNFEVVDHNQKNLYEYFAASTYQVGVFSTAIYEGLAFGCRTFIANLPGCEYMDDLVSKGIVRKFNSVEDLISSIDEPFDAQFDCNHFFS